MKNLLLAILARVLKTIAKLTLLRFKPAIIGITGNVGKTSAKEAIRTVLSSIRRVRADSKNFNNELGLPLVIIGDWDSTEGLFFWPKAVAFGVFQLIFGNPKYPELLILEYGIDRPGEMSYLLGIARPQIGIITAIGDVPVHVEFFAGPEAVSKEKEKLVSHLPATGFAILNADQEAVSEMRHRTRAHVVTYGFSDKADLRITNFDERLEFPESVSGLKPAEFGGIGFKLNYGGSFIPVRLDGVFGKTQAYSAAVAASVGLIMGMNLVRIADCLKGYSSPKGRLKVMSGIKGSILLDDTYNASPLSMEEALETLRRLKAKRKIAVLGDMLELGKYTFSAHESIGRIAEKNLDILITVGLRGKLISEAATKAGMKKSSIFAFNTLGGAAECLHEQIGRGDLVLFKASQGVRLERVIEVALAEPHLAKDLLVRQSKTWEKTAGLYDE